MLAVIMTLSALGETPSDSMKVYFRMGHSQFEPALRNNRAVMDSFVNIVREANAEDNIERIVVRGYASPDGFSKANERLSRRRCEAIASYVSGHTGVSREFIQTVAGGIAWTELRRMVEATPDVPSRDKVIDILDNTPVWVFDAQGKVVDGRKAQLMSLARGIPYMWMQEHIFPELRNAVAVAVFFKSNNNKANPLPPVVKMTQTDADSIRHDSSVTFEPEPSDTTGMTDLPVDSGQPDLTPPLPRLPSNRYFALKNNMLYDVALAPNIGVEAYVGKNLSFYGEWVYAWWSSNRRHRYWQIYGGDIGLRWWFGRKAHAKPLTGHHLGIYGGALIFDFEWGDTGYMGGKPGGTLWNRCIVNSGIEYGYSLPVGNRLNIDFSIGIGYLSGNYIKYFPFDNDYYREKEYKMRFFGPTKAEISLVWLIGRGNTNHRKGGDI